MAAGVLVKERIVEQNAGLIDGRIERHECAFAEVRASLVHFDELCEKVVVYLCVPFDCFSLVEADPEAVDELRLVGKGLRGVDDALCFSAHRGDEALLGRNVRVKDDTLQALFRAAAESGLGDHADMEIRAVGGFVVKLADVQAVEIRAPVVQVFVVCLPRSNRVLRHAGGCENRFPELFDGLARTKAGEELLRPFFARHGGNAPLVLVFNLVAVALDDRVFFLLGLGHLLLIDALEPVGVFGHQVNPAGNRVHIVLPSGFLVVVERRHRRKRPVAHMELFDRLVVPVDDDHLTQLIRHKLFLSFRYL